MIDNIIEKLERIIQDLKLLKEVTERNYKNSSLFLQRVEGLFSSARVFYTLKNNDIEYVGELVQRTRYELLRYPNFGIKSLKEIESVLDVMGLQLGMDVPLEIIDTINNLKKSKL